MCALAHVSCTKQQQKGQSAVWTDKTATVSCWTPDAPGPESQSDSRRELLLIVSSTHSTPAAGWASLLWSESLRKSFFSWSSYKILLRSVFTSFKPLSSSPLHLLVWLCLRASLNSGSIWSRGWPRESLSLGDRCSHPPPTPNSPPHPSIHTPQPALHSYPPVWVTDQGDEWLCVCHTGGLATALFLTKDKRVFREAGCLPEGDTMPWGWQACGPRAVHPVPALFEWARGGICLCVRVSNLRYYSRQQGRRQKSVCLWEVRAGTQTVTVIIL